MSELSGQPPSSEAPRLEAQALASSGTPVGARRHWGAPVVTMVAALVLLATGLAYMCWYPSEVGSAQPIPFSHRVHAGQKQISCLVCHNGAQDTARAEIPPLETCMLCHQRVIVTYPKICELRAHYENKEPVAWNRVYQLPEYVYFDHAVHLHRGLDCGQCHGNVREMDRVVQQQEFQMGFCIQCHREHDVTHDCFTCHR